MIAISIILVSSFMQIGSLEDNSIKMAKAQELVDEGSALYENGKWAQALEKFNAAYMAYPSPMILFNIGQANRDLGRPIEAIEAFEKFLVAVPEDRSMDIMEALSAVDDLKKNLGQLRIECDLPDAEISVDGKGVGVTPLPETIWTIPGPHQIIAFHVNAPPVIKNINAKPGENLPIVMQIATYDQLLAKTVPEPEKEVQAVAKPLQETSPGWWLGRKWTWAAAGSVVVFAGGATMFGVLAHSRYGDLQRKYGSKGSAEQLKINGDSTLNNLTTVANIFWGAAGVSAVTAGLLLYLEGHSVTVAPMVGETNGLSARTEF
jgi:hypothetical protein